MDSETQFGHGEVEQLARPNYGNKRASTVEAKKSDFDRIRRPFTFGKRNDIRYLFVGTPLQFPLFLRRS
jgi:hypothetical protein